MIETDIKDEDLGGIFHNLNSIQLYFEAEAIVWQDSDGIRIYKDNIEQMFQFFSHEEL